MDFFKWKESFNIGVAEIDRQHRSFLEYLNDCHHHLSGNRGAAIDPVLVEKLKAYAANHFHYEEALMRSAEFPRIELHEKQHRFFESQISELDAVRQESGERPPQSVLAFLRDWFLNHILEQDKRISKYLK
jgi:hemerythrin-like metal-binding protein